MVLLLENAVRSVLTQEVKRLIDHFWGGKRLSVLVVLTERNIMSKILLRCTITTLQSDENNRHAGS